jgi:hypothetical protein
VRQGREDKREGRGIREPERKRRGGRVRVGEGG